MSDSAQQRPTILLVEDEPIILRLTGGFLERQGFHVLQAANGAEALEQSAQFPGPIHVLVTDVVLPEQDGRELASRLLQQHRALQVVFMSGHTEKVVANHGVRPDAVHFLQKPFPLLELLHKVRQVLAEEPTRLHRKSRKAKRGGA
jgi:CheY-like chemotaxis protein